MTSIPVTVDDRLDLRCASWARREGVEPTGTAAYARRWLLVDWPLPWPRDAKEIEALAPLRAALKGTGTRLQLVVPRPEAETRTAVLHDAAGDDDGWFSGFARRERAVAPADLIDAAIELAAVASIEHDGATDGRVESDGERDGGEVDVLICGHGSRDRCCGSMGTALALAAVAGGRTVRRTSHTGGHRFAATGLVLPAGTCWAFLDDDLLTQVVDRSGPLDEVLSHYRGSVAFQGGAAQAAERVAFAAVGWSWLDHRRRAVELGDGRVRIDSVDPSGATRSWSVQTGPGRTLPVPECGHDPADAPKHETEVVVVVSTEIAPTW